MTTNIHATGLALDGKGVLIRGPSGAGKSLLALNLMERWQDRGRAAVLVADDQVLLASASGAVTMAAPQPIAGKIELRGRGILLRPFQQQARVDLVVDLVTGLERMPEEGEFTTTLMGIELARCPVPARGVIDPDHQMLLVAASLAALPAGLPQEQKTA